MAEETREEYEARISEELGDQYRQEADDITSAAEDARENERNDDGALKTWDDYNEHVANVPGIFGDIDTTAGAGASGVDAVSAKNELATVEVAQKDEAAEAGDDEAAAASDDEARRQADIAAPGAPSAEEVEAGAEAQDDDDDDSDDDDSDDDSVV